MIHFKSYISVLFFLFFVLITVLNAQETKNIIIKNNYKDVYFNVEIARKKIDRDKGLMFRKNLKLDKGMLFIFPNESKVSMWMKNTLISLDIIFISKNYKIVDIINNAKAMSKDILTSKVKAKYALEINAGLVKKLNIKIGNNIYFEEINSP
tara:strand:- start:221 stop:676 length:456 start_codon:yes stop_codon:yes gene_type:complete